MPATTDVPPPTAAAPAAAAAPVALQLDGLTKRYGDRVAVDALSFALHTGRICGIVGPNGAGKTTTIRMLLGLTAPTSGTATVLGAPLEQPSRYLPHVGAMIEGPAFLPQLSARQNLLMLARLDGHEDRIGRVLAAVGLTARAEDRVREFSLGMRQRLGIAAALLPDPRLLILDEPTNGLDPAGIREVRDLLRDLADGGTTVLVSSHLLDEIEVICDDLVVVRDGRLLFAGPLEDLLAAQRPRLCLRPEHPDDVGRLAAHVRTVAEHVDVNAGQVRCDGDDTTAAAVNRWAGAHGVVLVEIVASRPDLEATFFALTETEADR